MRKYYIFRRNSLHSISFQQSQTRTIIKAGVRFYFRYDELTLRNEGHFDDSTTGRHEEGKLFTNNKKTTRREIGARQGWIRRHNSHVIFSSK